MEPRLNSFPKPPILGTPAGYLTNGGVQRYLLEAESSTGFVAWKLTDGTTLVSEARQVTIAASPAVCFWSCAGYEDPSPAGHIVSFDCHGNSLTSLDVTGLKELEYLDCSFNQLTTLPLSGLTLLQGLDADNNQLADLEVRNLRALRVLNCAHNQLTKLDLSGLDLLEIVDCSANQLDSIKSEGCTFLRELNTKGNLIKSTFAE